MMDGAVVADFEVVGFGYGWGQGEIGDEVVVDELGGEDAGQGHVIGFAYTPAALDFADQLGDSGGVEQTGSFNPFWGEQLADVVGG